MDTTGVPDNGAPAGTETGAHASGGEAAPSGADDTGAPGWVSGDTAGEDFDYGAGYGYGPGYGGPGDSGYGYGYGPAPAQEGEQGGTLGDPAAASPQAQPVVGPTPALRGLPGGPGIQSPADVPGLGVPGRRAAAGLHDRRTAFAGRAAPGGTSGHLAPVGGSLWQRAQGVWSAAGIAWQRPLTEWQLPEAEWERVPRARTTRRLRPARQAGAGAASPGGFAGAGAGVLGTGMPGAGPPGSGVQAGGPPGAGPHLDPGTGPSGLPGSVGGRPPGRAPGSPPGPGPGGPAASTGRRPPRTGGRVIVTVVAMAGAVVLLTIVGLVAFGGGKPPVKHPQPRSPYPPARLADADFATSQLLGSRGIFQSLGVVASYGSTAAAAGTQTGADVVRGQFFVSVDDGRTWQLAPVTGPDGKPQVTSQAPTSIVAGPAGWLALGHGVSWTSKNGQSWRQSPAQGIAPMQPGDRVLTVTATARGFLAAGSAGVSGPVIWTSADGITWQRFGPGQLRLQAAGGAGGVLMAAAHGDNTVIAAPVTRTVVTGSGGNKRAYRLTETSFWQSVDGGQTWSRVQVPVGNGAADAVSGLASSGSGFVVVRPAADGSGVVVYTSATGSGWTYAAKLTGTKQAPLKLLRVAGSDQGAVIATVGGSSLVAYRSASGQSWQPQALGSAASAALSGLTVVAGGNVVAAGTSGTQGFLAVAGSARALIDLAAIRGASFSQRSIGAVASGPGRTIAVGSANGYPAVWTAPDGQSWSRALGASQAVFSRPGVSQLSGIARGPGGWLVVGAELNGAAAHPIIIFSRDGRTWQAADAQPPFAGADAGATGAVHGPRGYVVVGFRAAPGRTVAAAWQAPALTAPGAQPSGTNAKNRRAKQPPPLWTAGTDAGRGDLDGADAPRSMSAVTAGPFGYVAVGQHGSRAAVWVSADGRAWRLTDLPAVRGGTGSLRYVAASGDRIVAMGTASTASATAPLAVFSADGGRTWREVPVPVPSGSAHGSAAPGAITGVTGLTAVGGGFVAVGTVGQQTSADVAVLVSADGTAWKAVLPFGTGLSGPGVQEITALTTMGDRLLGAGFIATQTSEDATLWLAPALPAGAEPTPAASRR